MQPQTNSARCLYQLLAKTRKSCQIASIKHTAEAIGRFLNFDPKMIGNNERKWYMDEKTAPSLILPDITQLRINY